MAAKKLTAKQTSFLAIFEQQGTADKISLGKILKVKPSIVLSVAESIAKKGYPVSVAGDWVHYDAPQPVAPVIEEPKIELTEKERAVFKDVCETNIDDAGSDVESISQHTGLNINSVKGVVGSLVKKNLLSIITDERPDHKGNYREVDVICPAQLDGSWYLCDNYTAQEVMDYIKSVIGDAPVQQFDEEEEEEAPKKPSKKTGKTKAPKASELLDFIWERAGEKVEKAALLQECLGKFPALSKQTINTKICKGKNAKFNIFPGTLEEYKKDGVKYIRRK